MMLMKPGLAWSASSTTSSEIYKQRSLGLRSSAKLAEQAVVGALFALLILQQRFADGYDLTPCRRAPVVPA